MSITNALATLTKALKNDELSSKDRAKALSLLEQFKKDETTKKAKPVAKKTIRKSKPQKTSSLKKERPTRRRLQRKETKVRAHSARKTKDGYTLARRNIIKTKDGLRQALKNPNWKVREYQVTANLARYEKPGGWETFHFVFKLPKEASDAKAVEIVKQTMKGHVKYLEDSGYDIDLVTAGNGKEIDIIKYFEITSPNQVRSYLSNGFNVPASLRFQQTKGQFEFYESSQWCWIMAIVQGYATHNCESKKDFKASNSNVISEIQLREQFGEILSSKDRDPKDGIMIMDVIEWANSYQQQLVLHIWFRDVGNNFK